MKKTEIKFIVNDYSEMEDVELYLKAVYYATKSIGLNALEGYKKIFSCEINTYLICKELDRRGLIKNKDFDFSKN